jgi:hypothetical protein
LHSTTVTLPAVAVDIAHFHHDMVGEEVQTVYGGHVLDDEWQPS